MHLKHKNNNKNKTGKLTPNHQLGKSYSMRGKKKHPRGNSVFELINNHCDKLVSQLKQVLNIQTVFVNSVCD